jgi:hypothetical protein
MAAADSDEAWLKSHESAASNAVILSDAERAKNLAAV